MSGGYRFEIDASAGPALEGLLYDAKQLLVRVRMFDGPGVANALTGEPSREREVFTDLRPEQARDLARAATGRQGRREPNAAGELVEEKGGQVSAPARTQALEALVERARPRAAPPRDPRPVPGIGG
jgi:hypothetical protein